MKYGAHRKVTGPLKGVTIRKTGFIFIYISEAKIQSFKIYIFHSNNATLWKNKTVSVKIDPLTFEGGLDPYHF